jgi:hypothetical protein
MKKYAIKLSGIFMLMIAGLAIRQFSESISDPLTSKLRLANPLFPYEYLLGALLSLIVGMYLLKKKDKAPLPK